jgi:electron transport complex protein RnfC
LCRIGTPFIDLINACGGFLEEPTKIIMGGPMMGIAIAHTDLPALKCTTAVLSLAKTETTEAIVQPCIRCARCVDACPQHLLPNLLGDFSEHANHPQAKEYGALDCIECGCCAYVCPAKRNLVQLIKVSKYILNMKPKTS